MVAAFDALGVSLKEGESFLYQDLTNDQVPEVVISQYHLYVFGCEHGLYVTKLKVRNPDLINMVPAPTIAAIGDVNKDGMPEIIVGYYFLPYFLVQAFEWDGHNFRSLIEVGRPAFDCGADVAYTYDKYGTVQLQDVDRDGIQEMLLHGGVPANLSHFYDGYPWREETLMYKWNGQALVFNHQEFSPPKYRFQAVQDGDRYGLQKNYALAIAAYRQAIEDKTLEGWSAERKSYDLACFAAPDCTPPAPPSPDSKEYAYLASYAAFRIVVLDLLTGETLEAEKQYTALTVQFPSEKTTNSFAEMASAFWQTYQVTQDIGQACESTVDYARLHPQLLSYLGDEGHGAQSILYHPEDVCPFR